MAADSDQNSQLIQPSIGKIFLKSFMTIVTSVILISAVILYIHWTIGFDVFVVPFDALGIETTAFEAMVYTIIAICSVAILVLAVNLLMARNTKYQFYLDHLVVQRVIFLIFFEKITVHYKNLARISYDYDGIFNMILKTGTITLDLNGMDRERIKLEFMENVEELVQQIQMLLNQFMVAITQEKQRSEQIEDIVNKI